MEEATEEQQSLYDRMGGDATVKTAVDQLYDKVMNDPQIKPFFKDINMDRQRNKMKAFITYSFGGSPNYPGLTMGTSHRALVEKKGLTDKHFDALVGHLLSTLQEMDIDQNLIDEASAILEESRSDVLRGSTIKSFTDSE